MQLDTSRLGTCRRSRTCWVSHYVKRFAIIRWLGQSYTTCGIHNMEHCQSWDPSDVANATDDHDHYLTDLVQVALGSRPSRVP